MKSGMRVVQDNMQKVMATIQAIQKDAVYVGVPADESSRSDGFNNAQIGYINEKGSMAASIPPRPHLVPGVASVSKECADELGIGVANALTTFNATDIVKGQNRAGLIAQNAVRAFITAGDGFKPLSKVTLLLRSWKRGGMKISGANVFQAKFLVSNNLEGDLSGVRNSPLIDTGQYRKSITYVVRPS